MDDNKLKVKVGSIDLTPTWESILPVLLEVHNSAETSTARQAAFNELRRMAQIADLFVASSKRRQDRVKERNPRKKEK